MLLGPRESCKDTSCYYVTVHAIMPWLRAQKAMWYLGEKKVQHNMSP